MLNFETWFTRELIAITLVIIFAYPLHKLSDIFWARLSRSKVNKILPRQDRIPVLTLVVIIFVFTIVTLSIILGHHEF